MAQYLVTRKRHLHESVWVEAPSAAEAKRRADEAAATGKTHTQLGTPENWHTQKQVRADG